MINKISYLRNKISTFLVLSAAILIMTMLLSSSQLFNLLPVQAQTTQFSFRTTEPANGAVQCSSTAARLTFDVQGTPSSSNPQRVDITGGTFQISDNLDGQVLYSGNIHNGRFTNSNGAGSLILYTEVNGASTCASTGDSLTINTACSTSNGNPISVGYLDLGLGPNGFGTFNGAVECSSSQGGGDTQSMARSSQDGDGDGILDANDNCPNIPQTKCYTEGTTIVVNSNR